MPDWVPSGIFMATLPSRVGTSISQPSEAWMKLIGNLADDVVVFALEEGMFLDADGDVQVAVGAALALAPFAGHLQA